MTAGVEVGRVEAGELAEPPAATPELYQRIGHARLNNGLPALQVQYSVYNEKHSLIGCFGSWRSGKTRGGALRIGRCAFENPWRDIYGRANPFSYVISETDKVLGDATMPELLSVLPDELILRVWESKAHRRIRMVNGHDILFRTWSGSIEGGSACGVWVDEAHKLDGPDGPTKAWTNYVMRATDARASGKVVIATGLPEYGYLSDLFDQPATEDRVTYLCSLLDNFYLDPSDIERLKAACTEEEAETVIHGRWRKPSDVVFYAFGEAAAPAGNYVSVQGDPAAPVDLAMDLGDFGAILVSQRIKVRVVDARGRAQRVPGVLIVDEWLPTDMDAESALKAFLREKRWHLASSSTIYLDPTASRDQIAAVRRVLRLDAANAPRLVRRSKADSEARRAYGYRCCNVGFRDSLGNRRLFVYDGLPRSKRSLITALRRHRKKADGTAYRDNWVDHVADCLRYLVSDQLPLQEGAGVDVRKRAV